MTRNVLKSSIRRASFNIVFQILFRCVTFLMNAFVVRHINQDVIGVINVRLLLLESTVLFLSREAFRRACLSRKLAHSWQQVVNLLWITVPLCSVLSALFGYIWLYVLTPPSTLITSHYSIGVFTVCVSCVIEMCCEPIYIAAEILLFLRLKVFMDTVHVVVRTMAFTPLIVYIPDGAVIAFSVAQILSVSFYTIGYYIYFYFFITYKTVVKDIHGSGDHSVESSVRIIKRDKPRDADSVVEESFPFNSLKDFLPRKLEKEPAINYNMAVLTWSFFKQGVMKQMLTEGERYIMTVFSVITFYEQGVYDIVNNLGSLAARFIFRPIEEAAYFYFSQTVHRDIAVKDQDKKDIEESSRVLQQLLYVLSSLGLLIVTFGQSYSRLLLLLYGGEKLILYPGPLLMQTHSLAVLLLAINGITECYALATMSATQIDKYNYFMVVLSMGFLLISLVFTKLFGSVGFILANCCNMLARILHNSLFVHKCFRGTPYRPLSGLIPGTYYATALLTAGILLKLSELYLFESSKLLHLANGVLSLLAVVAVWAYESKVLIRFAFEKVKQKVKQ